MEGTWQNAVYVERGFGDGAQKAMPSRAWGDMPNTACLKISQIDIIPSSFAIDMALPTTYTRATQLTMRQTPLSYRRRISCNNKHPETSQATSPFNPASFALPRVHQTTQPKHPMIASDELVSSTQARAQQRA